MRKTAYLLKYVWLKFNVSASYEKFMNETQLETEKIMHNCQMSNVKCQMSHMKAEYLDIVGLVTWRISSYFYTSFSLIFSPCGGL